ncbi:MAG TPA: ABC transporter substrate-binding protein, partial [Anaerolineae bacterium]|nr:ABC transporter substrate-binding protein [Anaerolineae bacterium]
MFNRKLAILVVVLMVAPIVLAACGPTPEPEVVVETVVVEQTRVVEVEGTPQTIIETVEVEVTAPPQPTAEAEPTAEPVSERTGAWVDRIIMVEEESQEAAVTRLQAGDIDVYAFSADDPSVFETVQGDENLSYTTNFGSYNEMTLNPVGPEFTDGRLNPFSNPKIREALNWLIDRDYIVQEIAGGLGIPKILPINSNFPDAARYIAKMRELQAKYAYNPETAEEIITTEMEGMGAELVDDVWQYNGQPVTIIMIIRTEDSRTQIGDYVGNQLETVGFTVDRQYRTRTEASPIWVGSNPADGQWHIYTGGWITQIIDRDASEDFAFFYLPYDYPIPLHQAYTPSPEFDEVGLALRNTEYTSMEERDELFERAMELALEDSVRVWVVDQTSFSPFRGDITITGDLAGGMSGGYQWPWTLRYEGEEGGTVRIAQPGLLVDPWNPVAGSNWVFDGMPQRATEDQGFMFDPFTGLVWPHRVERAEVVVQEGLPVTSQLDWVDLSFEPEIVVPDDAWVDWDATNQQWITAGEFYPEPPTALTKSTVYYPEDMYDTVMWHDGSPISAADFVMPMLLLYDAAKPESAIYDE